MSDEFFGDDKPEHEPQLKIMFPCRPVNQIEGDLGGAMHEAMRLEVHRAPMIFVDEEDGAYNAAEYGALYGALTLREAITLRDIVFGEVVERYRRQMIVARECGDSATMDDYLIACECEGIDRI